MHKTINTTDLKWADAPPVLPKGAQLTVLSGVFVLHRGDLLDTVG
jgi:hypothetical protein